MSEPALHKAVLEFWKNAGPEAWFAKDEAFDRAIREQFEALHHAAARGELAVWADDSEGALALILLLDQFPRNLYRNSPHAYATDGLALAVAEHAVRQGFDKITPLPLRIFFYLPFEHSEELHHQDHCVGLMQETGDADFVKWAKIHRDIVEQFGRFPHRNVHLGRPSSTDELAFLESGGFTG
jgi:uncharacterized protein (DUF924 family)